jgi:hypothetical protein
MNEKLSRRELLQAALAVSATGVLSGCASAALPKPAPLAGLDAVGTAEAIRKGDLTAQEAVEAAIRRAQAVDPRINAIVTEAYDRARASARGTLSGAFAGVPTFIKDLDDVRGLPTHSGSRSFGHEPATGQGPYVDALERSGLVILGKSSTPEFGLTGSTEPLLHGPTRNPWNLDYSPGGSSGGAAALVAARVVPIAHATDGGVRSACPPRAAVSSVSSPRVGARCRSGGRWVPWTLPSATPLPSRSATVRVGLPSPSARATTRCTRRTERFAVPRNAACASPSTSKP